MKSCQERIAIVTGAAGAGMGRSIALTLAREGATVIVNYRASKDSAEKIAAKIQAGGTAAVPIQADITKPDDCRRLVEQTVKKYGRVDICVIGPGAGWHPEPIDRLNPAGALEDVSHEVAPFYYLMPHLLPGMYERKWGRIVGLALHPLNSPAYAYNAAKAARTQAMLLAHPGAWSHGVTINVIAPGPVQPIAKLKDAIELCQHGPRWNKRKNTTPQDIAEGVAMLCSDAGRFISGCVMPYQFHAGLPPG